MNSFLSAFLGIAAAVVCVVAFASLFIVRGWELAFSLAMSVLLAGAFFAFSVYFDRRDARLHRRPYQKVLPRRQSVFAFAFVVYVCVAFISFLAAVVYGWMQIPAGDDWGLAATRLIYAFIVVLLAWQSYNAVVGIAQRFFQGYVYDDYLASVGKPLTWERLCDEINRSLPLFWLIAIAVVGIAILFDAIEWAEPMLEWKGGGRRIRKYKVLLSWMLNHPNTVDLFAITSLVASVSVIVSRLNRFVFSHALLGDDRE